MPPSSKDRLVSFLRWTEKYTKTDMVYLAKGGFWSVSAQIVTTLLVLGFAILVARVLPKDVYGQYKYILATVALLSSFSLTGLGTAVFQSVASGFDGALRQGFIANLRWSAVIFLGAFGLAAYYLSQGNSTLSFGILVGGSLSPFLTSANLAGMFLSAKKDFARSNIYFSIVENLIAIGALAITVLLTHDPLVLATVYFAGNTFATYLLYRRVIRVYRPDPAKTDSSMVTYAKHLSVMGILNGIASNIDQILLFHFVGPVQLAIYNFAVAIPDQTKGPIKTLGTMVQAKFVTRTAEEIKKRMAHKLWMLFIASTIFVLVYILSAPTIFRFLFPNYTDAVLYSQIYALSLLGLFATPAGSFFAAKKMVREQYAATVLYSTFQIAVLYVGVISWGLMGLIVSRVVIRIFSGILTLSLYQFRNKNLSEETG